MGNLSKLEIFVNFGFKNDPFKAVSFKTGDSVRLGRILAMAVRSKAMISVVGDRGAGKTSAVTDILKKMNTRQVFVRTADKTKILISDIEHAMVYDLSEEKPKRGREVRARQLRRILGEASQRHDIVVIIEEAHRIHGMTLRSLKTLREMEWMGESELFSVILIGQSDPMNKAGVAEVRLRSDTVSLKGLTSSEIVDYIGQTVGKAFDSESVAIVSHMADAKNFLNLQDILVRLMGRAYLSNRDKVTKDIVSWEFGDKVEKTAPVDTSGVESEQNEIKVIGNDDLQRVLNRRNSGKNLEKKISVVGR